MKFSLCVPDNSPNSNRIQCKFWGNLETGPCTRPSTGICSPSFHLQIHNLRHLTHFQRRPRPPRRSPEIGPENAPLSGKKTPPKARKASIWGRARTLARANELSFCSFFFSRLPFPRPVPGRFLPSRMRPPHSHTRATRPEQPGGPGGTPGHPHPGLRRNTPFGTMRKRFPRPATFLFRQHENSPGLCGSKTVTPRTFLALETAGNFFR